MTIVCFGTTFRQAPISLREKLVVSTSAVVGALVGEEGESPFDELVAVSTCNRTEFYGVAADRGMMSDHGFERLVTWLVETRGVARASINDSFYRYQELDAVKHLARVAAGLDSLIVGESEIARQVARSVEAAGHIGAVGEVLSRVFRTAIRAGRRARAETGINRKPASVSSVAVALADEVAGGLEGKRVVLVGTGKMGRLAGNALQSRGVEDLTVMNRTYQNATRLAGRLGGTARRMDGLRRAVAGADIVITSTGADGLVIDESLVRSAMRSRPDRALTVIDIALPRDVDAAVANIRGVQLFDIDALQDRIADHVAARQDEIPLVEEIIDQEVATFAVWLSQLSVRPLITDLRTRAERIRRAEIARTLRHLGTIDAETRDHIEHLSRSLVNKLLHEPTQRLRASPKEYEVPEVAGLTRELFGLQTDRRRTRRRAPNARVPAK